ncbi:hypothetical protein RRG08_061025 [Elysia crispata]|uniref:Uncharacterized protein n=1 Tax=Elysia crispata TaxID=231223 RepID=A0AAE1E4W6_9GAST|nr:hypothetical protein RRG08_061025 [Elysia crispata]
MEATFDRSVHQVIFCGKFKKCIAMALQETERKRSVPRGDKKDRSCVLCQRASTRVHRLESFGLQFYTGVLRRRWRHGVDVSLVVHDPERLGHCLNCADAFPPRLCLCGLYLEREMARRDLFSGFRHAKNRDRSTKYTLHESVSAPGLG